MNTVPILADIGTRRVERDEVLRYEAQRIRSAATRLGVDIPTSGDISRRRAVLLEHKLTLGPTDILRRFRRELAISGLAATAGARLGSRRRSSVVDVYAPTGSAAQFADYYWECVRNDDQAGLLRAHPDHFVQRIGADGRHEVVETTGGSPAATHFFIRYDDDSGLQTSADARFPLQIVGAARVGKTVVGGVRHQLRDTDNGFHARLTVEFPLPTPTRMIEGHRWHLAAEFSNWIEAAVQQS